MIAKIEKHLECDEESSRKLRMTYVKEESQDSKNEKVDFTSGKERDKRKRIKRTRAF